MGWDKNGHTIKKSESIFKEWKGLRENGLLFWQRVDGDLDPHLMAFKRE
jgi:hypothetical protein